jgi:COP9 signalosome complex subunit 5
LSVIRIGQVAIGSFRAYPDSYKEGKATEVENIPLAKIEEFGLHANKYYKLDTVFFKSKTDQDLLDRLWTRYWTQTIASQSLVKNREFMTGRICDISGKLEKCKMKGIGRGHGTSGKEEYGKIVKEAIKTALETSEAISMELLKDMLFNKTIS